MNYSLEFDLPGLPTMTNGNRRHWIHLHKEAKRWKDLVRKATIGARPLKPLPRAKLWLIRYSSVAPDPDGLVSGFKHIIDGLVEAGILENDKFTNIGMPFYSWQKVKRTEGRVSILVEDVPPL